MSSTRSISFKIVSVFLSLAILAVSLPLSVFATQVSIQSPIELEDKRDAFSKTYLNPDGTYISQMYAEQIHEDTTGKWKEIDNTLSYSHYCTIINNLFGGC